MVEHANQETKRGPGRPRKPACDKCGGPIVASRCPPCHKAVRAAWQARNPERLAAYRGKARASRVAQAAVRAERERQEAERAAAAYQTSGRAIGPTALALGVGEERARRLLLAAGVDLRWRDHSAEVRSCVMAGCGAKHYAKGLCRRHYWQQPEQMSKACKRTARAARTDAGRERIKVSGMERRARQRGAPGGRATPAELAQLVADADYRCTYCRAEFDPAKRRTSLTFDHVVPLVKGGTHEASNLRPACWSCNASKKDKALEEWRGPPHSVQGAA